MKRRPSSHIALYLFLNILVSAGVTLGVLYFWDQARPKLPREIVDSVSSLSTQVASTPQKTGASAVNPDVESEILPQGEVIQITTIVGTGDVTQEVVMLKRVGEGDLRMAGWKLSNGRGDIYEFPAASELILFKNGALQIFSRAGTDTAVDVFWNRSDPAFRSGDIVTLLDPQGAARAEYVVP